MPVDNSDTESRLVDIFVVVKEMHTRLVRRGASRETLAAFIDTFDQLALGLWAWHDFEDVGDSPADPAQLVGSESGPGKRTS